MADSSMAPSGTYACCWYDQFDCLAMDSGAAAACAIHRTLVSRLSAVNPRAGLVCIELAIDPQQGPPSSEHYCVASAAKQQAVAAADTPDPTAG